MRVASIESGLRGIGRFRDHGFGNPEAWQRRLVLHKLDHTAQDRIAQRQDGKTGPYPESRGVDFQFVWDQDPGNGRYRLRVGRLGQDLAFRLEHSGRESLKRVVVDVRDTKKPHDVASRILGAEQLSSVLGLVKAGSWDQEGLMHYFDQMSQLNPSEQATVAAYLNPEPPSQAN